MNPLVTLPSSTLVLGYGQKFVSAFVATLALGSRPRQKGLQGCRPREIPGITSHTPGSVGKCEGVNPHTPKATLTLGDRVPWTPETSERNFRGQNSMDCDVLYITGKLLELRCLKWACIAHLDI
jgi:hypothetical protein